ncbi:hypothetical protein [Mucilaginibacter sp.]
MILFSLQHKTTFNKKQADVRKWLDHRPLQFEQYTIIQVNEVVKLSYNQRYRGLFEKSHVQQLLQTNQYWVVRELN